MDASLGAAVVGCVVAGAGGLLVPRLIARIPEVEPEPAAEAEPSAGAEPEVPAMVAKAERPPPEPFADIARLPGLAWKSAVAAAVAGAALGAGLGWQWALVMWIPLVPAYVALALVDWRTRLLPVFVIGPLYGVLVALVVIGWPVTGDPHAVVQAALGWLCYGLVFGIAWFIYPPGMGYGDVRLAGLLGISLGWLGWGPLFVGMFAGLVLGGVLGGVLTLARIVDRRNSPFGPYMLLGALIGVLWGAPLWSGLVRG